MSTLTERNHKPATLFHANPVLRRLGKVEERSETDAATYRGIASKTTFFLVLTMLGMMFQILVHAALVNEPVWHTFEFSKGFIITISMKEAIMLMTVLLGGLAAELTAIFARRTIPVAGSLYAASQGYVISFIVFTVLKGYEYLGLEALAITVAVIGVMSWLYSSGIIKADKKFHTVLLSLVLGSIIFGVFTFVGSLIPAIRPYVQTLLQNAGLMIAVDVVGIVIASLFLISDFAMVDDCVREGYPKAYEWDAAFGLTFTVLWIYMKVLDLVIRLSGKSNKS